MFGFTGQDFDNGAQMYINSMLGIGEKCLEGAAKVKDGCVAIAQDAKGMVTSFLPQPSPDATPTIKGDPAPVIEQQIERPAVPMIAQSASLSAACESFRSSVLENSPNDCSFDQLGQFESTHFRGAPVQVAQLGR